MIEILKVGRATPVKTTLTAEQRQGLAEIATRPGYETLLRMMEMECVLQDVALVGTNPADERGVIAQHRVAKAMWEFFTNIQRQVEYEVNELHAQHAPVPRAESDAHILDPTATE